MLPSICPCFSCCCCYRNSEDADAAASSNSTITEQIGRTAFIITNPAYVPSDLEVRNEDLVNSRPVIVNDYPSTIEVQTINSHDVNRGRKTTLDDFLSSNDKVKTLVLCLNKNFKLSVSNSHEIQSNEIIINSNLAVLSRGQIPEQWPSLNMYDKGITSFLDARSYQIKYKGEGIGYRGVFNHIFFMYALVDRHWTGILAKYLKNNHVRNCVELGSGKGWLAKALTEHGMNIVATDDYSWVEQARNKLAPVFDVKKISASDAGALYKCDAFIVSWPAPDMDFYTFLPEGHRIVYIGHIKPDMSGNSGFFKCFEVEHIIPIPGWIGDENSFCFIGKKISNSSHFMQDTGEATDVLKAQFPIVLQEKRC